MNKAKVATKLARLENRVNSDNTENFRLDEESAECTSVGARTHAITVELCTSSSKMSLLPPLVRISCRDAVVSSGRKAGQGGRKRNANESKSLFSLDPFPVVHTLDIYCRGIKDATSAWKMASIWKLETLRSKRRNEEGERGREE